MLNSPTGGLDAIDPATDVGILFALDYTDADGTPGYENGGNITGVTRHSRVSGMYQTMSFTYGYDALNRLAGAGLQTSADGIVLQFGTYSYTMDARGNLTAQNKTGGGANGAGFLSPGQRPGLTDVSPPGRPEGPRRISRHDGFATSARGTTDVCRVPCRPGADPRNFTISGMPAPPWR